MKRRGNKVRSLAWWCVVVGVPGALVTACPGPHDSKTTSSAGDSTAWAFGCPEHNIRIKAFEDSVITSIPIAPTTDVMPEYHDCQRFVVNKEFGPLVAIWAAESVASYFPALKPGESDHVAYAIAQIVDLGNGPTGPATAPEDYEPLHISREFNCLDLWRRAAPDTFEARIVPPPKPGDFQGCVGTRAIDRDLLAAPRLSVQATLFAAGDSLPVVARWDWDSNRGVQYISIWCGTTAWCEIGPDEGFTPSVAIAAEPAVNAALDAAYESAPGAETPPARWNAVRTVKGWYDQQRLEVWDRETGELTPSDIVGTIVPHPVLAAIMESGATAGVPNFEKHWMPAAYIHVPKSYQLKTFSLGAGVSRMYLCHGTSAECPGSDNSVTGIAWFSKLTSPGLAPQYRLVDYEDHGGKTIPAAAARWRWLETDGTMWVRCGFGCCTDK